jgi:hypothetical protein
MTRQTNQNIWVALATVLQEHTIGRLPWSGTLLRGSLKMIRIAGRISASQVKDVGFTMFPEKNRGRKGGEEEKNRHRHHRHHRHHQNRERPAERFLKMSPIKWYFKAEKQLPLQQVA